MLLTQAAGRSQVHETIFEDRLELLTGLSRMGARIRIQDANHATITGIAPLHGAETEIGDLRAGASMILAALAADGTSLIHGAHHVHRGYENIEPQVPGSRRVDHDGRRVARAAPPGQQGVATSA